MTFYIIILIALLILSFIPQIRNSKVLLFVFATVLIIFAAIRSLNVGTDTYNYYLAFRFPDRELAYYSNSLEVLYWWLIKFCGYFFNYDLYMFIVYVIIITPVACVINKQSDNKFLSLLLYVCLGCYTSSFNTMRQAIAVSISLYAFYQFEKGGRKLCKHAIICHLIAFLFHGSSIICLGIYLLRYIQLNKIVATIIVTCSFVIGFFMSDVLNDIFQLLSVYGGKYEAYFNMFSGGEDRNLLSNLGVNLVILSVILLSPPSLSNSSFFWGSIAYIVLFNICGSMGYLVRISDYFLIFQVISIPNVQIKIQNSFVKNGYFCFIIVYCIAIFFLRTLTINEVVPYSIRF